MTVTRLTILYVFCLFSFMACQPDAQQQNKTKVDGSLVQNPATISGDSTHENAAILTFETTEHDFGKIKEGDKVTYDFQFTNTGKTPLLISAVKASCGCTTPDWPKEPVPPGETGKIKVQYDSKGREGEFSKGIVVTANTYPNTMTIKISGVVFK